MRCTTMHKVVSRAVCNRAHTESLRYANEPKVTRAGSTNWSASLQEGTLESSSSSSYPWSQARNILAYDFGQRQSFPEESALVPYWLLVIFLHSSLHNRWAPQHPPTPLLSWKLCVRIWLKLRSTWTPCWSADCPDGLPVPHRVSAITHVKQFPVAAPCCWPHRQQPVNFIPWVGETKTPLDSFNVVDEKASFILRDHNCPRFTGTFSFLLFLRQGLTM